MIDPLAVRQQLIGVANRVDDLMSSPTGIRPSRHLRELGEAVAGGQDADAWSHANVYDMLNIAEIVEQLKSQPRQDRIADWLELARNVFIFFPLIWTWLALSQAVSTYNSLLADVPTLERQPFLLLWEQGFNGRTAFLFSRVAFVDFVLLMLIVCLTGAIFYWTSFVDRRRSRSIESLRTELQQALADATLTLTTRKWQQPTNFVERFESIGQGLITQLHKEYGRIAGLTALQDKQLTDLTGVTTAFAASAQTFAAATGAFDQSLHSLSSNVTTLTAPMQKLATQQDALLGTMDSAVGEIRGLAGEQRRLTDAQNAHSTDLHSAVQTVSSAITTLTQSANAMHTVAAGLTTAQTEFLQSLATERDAQRDLAMYMAMAARGLEDGLKQVKDYTVELNGMSVDLRELNRSLPSLPQTLRTQLFDVLKDHSATVKSIADAAHRLEQTAGYLEQSGTSLRLAAEMLSNAQVEGVTTIANASASLQAAINEITVTSDRLSQAVTAQTATS